MSELGYLQAKCIPDTIETTPDLIVISPYLRTELTAQPLIDKLPHVPVEVWQVQEFTYLSLALDLPTTILSRKPLTQAYWERCDPNYSGSRCYEVPHLSLDLRRDTAQPKSLPYFINVESAVCRWS